jgi:hypothetical protein
MTDYFALFGEQRRPWLEPEALKEKYYGLSRAAPPNEEINEAFRVLSDTKLRLQHLLALCGVEVNASRPIPPILSDLFWKTGAVIRQVDTLLQKTASENSLTRALLKPELLEAARQIEQSGAELEELHAAALDRLRSLDESWEADHEGQFARLIELHDTFSYIGRLLEQTRERQLQLSL